MENKVKVILVTTYFPPLISVASNRMEAFAKYLNHDLFDLEVVTLDSSEEIDFEPLPYVVTRFPNDVFFSKATFQNSNSFLNHKVKALYNKVLSVFVKNEFAGWQRKVEIYLERIIKENPNSIVISSFAPSAAHLAVLNTKKKGLSFKWIADFRDSMTNPAISTTLLKSNTNIQKQVLTYADVVTTVSEPIIDEFKLISSRPSEVFYEIRNGYDFDLPTSYAFNPVFTISYIGTFYGSRKPNFFFKALKRFQEKNPNVHPKIQLVGVGSSIQVPEFIQQQTTITNKVSHKEALSYMINSDALLLLHPQSDYKGVYTGKVFEYLACLKPIIATVDKADVAAKLIIDCNAGFIASFDNVNEIEKAINDAYQLWSERKQLNSDLSLIKKHHRKVQIDKLNTIITDLIN